MYYYKRLSLRAAGALSLRVAGVHVACITVFDVISDFLIHRRPINNLTCPS